MSLHYLGPIVATLFALLIGGCCGNPQQGAVSAASSTQPIGRPSATAPGNAHRGCDISGALGCGGETLFGFKAELPPLPHWITGPFSNNVNGSRAVPAQTASPSMAWQQIAPAAPAARSCAPGQPAAVVTDAQGNVTHVQVEGGWQAVR